MHPAPEQSDRDKLKHADGENRAMRHSEMKRRHDLERAFNDAAAVQAAQEQEEEEEDSDAQEAQKKDKDPNGAMGGK